MKLLQIMLISAFAIPAYAHGPTPQKTDQTVLLNTAHDVVWKALSEPCAITAWHPHVVDCKVDGTSRRALTLKNGGTIIEEIDEMLPQEMSISYRLGRDSEVKALPVSSLTGRIKVKAEGDKTNVAWIARYYRADTTNEPPQGLDDAAAQTSINSYVMDGLTGLEAHLEQK